LTIFLFLFVSSSYQKIPESVAEYRSLLIPISFKSCVFFSISLKYFGPARWEWGPARPAAGRPVQGSSPNGCVISRNSVASEMDYVKVVEDTPILPAEDI